MQWFQLRHVETRHNEKDTIWSDTWGVTLVGVPGRVTTKVLGDLINTAPSHLLVRHTRGYVLGGETTAASLLVCPVV